MRTNLTILLAVGVALVSCRGPQALTGTETPTSVVQNATALPVENLTFERMLIKGKGKVEAAGGKTRRFKYRVHIEQGQRLWVSVVALGVEGVRLLATPDSVVFINRLDETYFSGSYDWLSAQTGLPLTYQLLEDALLGNAHPYTDTLSTQPPYAFGFRAGGYRVLYELSERTARPKAVVTFDSTATQRTELQYRQYKQLGGSSLAYQLILKLEGGALRKLDLEHKEVDTAPGELPFSVRIPRHYKPVAGS